MDYIGLLTLPSKLSERRRTRENHAAGWSPAVGEHEVHTP